MHLVLVLPGLFAMRNADAVAPAPALANVLASAGTPTRDADGLGAALATHYGVARQQDWPLAAIRAASLGVDAADGYWLAADPVTLEVGRDDVAFAGIVDDLARADADAIVATLNEHFAADGIVFLAPRPDAMFARLADTPRVTTHPPAVAPDEPLRLRLPDGPDASTWRRWQSEIQMLLHEHPVNIERERTGRSPANSVWFSAGGTLPARVDAGPSTRTFANAGIAIALAAHAGSKARPVPADLGGALDAGGEARLVVVAFDAATRIDSVETAWAAPAWAGLKAGRIEPVSILAEDGSDAVIWRASRPGLRERIAAHIVKRDFAALVARAKRRE